MDPRVASPIVLCYHLKFVSLFRNFIPPQELLDIANYCSDLLKNNSLPLQKMALTLLGQILNCKESQIEDDMNKSIDNSSFYSKYYMNPRKVKVKLQDRRIFNPRNIYPAIESILQNLYLYVSSLEKLEPVSLVCLERIFKALEGDVQKYVGPLIEMFKIIFKQIEKGYTYEGLKSIFESVGTFITNSGGNSEAAKEIFDKFVTELNGLMNKGINDVTCFLLQIYAIIMRCFGKLPEGIMVGLDNSRMS